MTPDAATTPDATTTFDIDALPAVTTAAELEGFGLPAPPARDKVRPHLHHLDRRWLAAAPLCFVGTSDAAGRCDVSPKGDPAGSLVHVIDAHTLVLPERAGNKRMDGMHNLLANPHIGLTFVIPGRADLLRVNGIARIVTDGPFWDELEVKGHRPELAIVVRVEEVFYHCAKAFLRSRTWQPDTWRPDAVPRHAVIAKTLVRPEDSLAELYRYYGPSYAAGLYPRTPRD